jgi:D,D-heptose 1,7-bisphosphate phosphatase
MSANAIFLDKDGTLIPDIPYNIDPDKISLSEGAGEGLNALSALGYHLFLVSNQPGIALGYFREEALEAVNEKIADLLAAYNVSLSGFYYCPHHPLGRVAPFNRECACKKPLPGMLYKAAKEHDIDLKASWMIGDILNDIEAGNRAGCTTILLDNGNETEWKAGPQRQPDFRAASFSEATAIIVAQKKIKRSFSDAK